MSIISPILTIRGDIANASTYIGSPAAAIPTTELNGKTSILIRNNGSNTIFLGASGVTALTGMPLKADETLPIAIASGVRLYGIAQTGSSDIRTFEGA